MPKVLAAALLTALPAGALAEGEVVDTGDVENGVADPGASDKSDAERIIEPEVAPEVIEPADAVRYGVGLRVHAIALPRGIIELFADEAPSGMLQPGFGLDFVRRRGSFEILLGIAYERISFDDGLWVEKGNGTLTERTDFVQFDGSGLLAAEAIFLSHTEIASNLFLRYGGGFGIGILIGDILQTDTRCNGVDSSSCTPITSGPGDIEEPADPFPVYPVVSILGGLQYRPSDQVSIALEGGLRNVLFVGLSGQYYF